MVWLQEIDDWLGVPDAHVVSIITMYEVVYLGEFDLTSRNVFTLDGDTLTVNITGVEELAAGKD